LVAQQGKVGQPLTFSFSATSPDGDPLTYSSDNLPLGATLDTGGNFRWTPQPAQAGTYQFDVSVGDGARSAAQTVTLNIADVDRGPIMVPLIPQTTSEAGTLQFTLQ